MKINSKFYQHGLPQSFHISVGGVLFNEDNEICIHHFDTNKLPENLKFLAGGLDEYYHLMRESLEGNEPLHDAVLRGVQEEFGAEGTVDKYLGSKLDIITGPNQNPFEKLTIYHAIRLTKLGERPDIDVENKTVMEWHSPQDALEMYKTQASKTSRPELDESVIVERFIEAYNL